MADPDAAHADTPGHTTDAAPDPRLLVLGVAAAVAAISSAALVILLAAPLEPTLIGAGRVLVTGLAMSLLAGRAAWTPWRAAMRDPALRRRMLLAGGLLALHFGTWVASLTLTTVVRSVTLVATQPLFAGVYGRWLGDRATWRSYVAGAIAVAGTAVMFADGSGAATPPNAGDALALLAGAAAAGYLAVGRSLRTRLSLTAYLGAIHLIAAVSLAAVAVGTGVTWVPAGAEVSDLLALLYLGLVPGVVGHGLLNWAVRFAPVHVVSLAIVLEPVGAVILAVAVLGGSVSSAEAIGAGIVLAAVAVGVVRPGRRSSTARPAR